MTLNETQQAFKDGYLKARQEDEQVYKDFLKRLSTFENATRELVSEIPEIFESLEDSENYHYCQGVLVAINRVKDFLGA